MRNTAFWDFIGARDALGRDADSFLYAPEYLIFFAIATLTAIILPLCLRKTRMSTVKRVIVTLWAVALVIDVFMWWTLWIDSAFHYFPTYERALTFLLLLGAATAAVAIGAPVLYNLVLKKQDFMKKRGMRIAALSVWGVALALVVFMYFSFFFRAALAPNGEMSIGAHLPLHTCSTFMYTAPIAFFAKHERIKRAASNYLCTINLFGGLVGMYVATARMQNNSLFSFSGAEHMIYHAIVIIVPMIMLITGFYKPKKHGMWLGLAAFAVIAIPMFVFNTASNAVLLKHLGAEGFAEVSTVDYMYIYDCSTLGIFNFIAVPISSVSPVLWTLVAFAAYILISAMFHYSILGITKLHDIYVAKHKSKPKEQDKHESGSPVSV